MGHEITMGEAGSALPLSFQGMAEGQQQGGGSHTAQGGSGGGSHMPLHLTPSGPRGHCERLAPPSQGKASEEGTAPGSGPTSALAGASVGQPFTPKDR